MDNKKFILFLNIIVSIYASAAGTLPPISRQQHLPKDFENRIEKLKELKQEKKEVKTKQKEALHEQHKCFYLAHQKNRLAYFADHDGFIWFDDKDNKYTFFLSNFYPAKIKVWDMKFSCSEAAFQAAKFLHKPELAVRFTHLDGEEAWKLAQRHSYQQRADWYQVRENIMQEVLRAKFKQHIDLRDLLLATGDAYLVENSSRDAFWADGGDGKGKNRLGQLLMQLRGELGGIGPISKSAKYKQFVE